MTQDDPIALDDLKRSTNVKTDINRSHPIQPDQEWANAWSHGLAALLWVGVGWFLISSSLASNHVERSTGLAAAVSVYVASVLLTFTCSTLSHVFLEPPWLDRFRSADQASIYLMIVGTYTPIVLAFAPTTILWPLMVGMWIGALIGFFAKLILNHRIDSISTVSYLLLGWLPAIPMFRNVPISLGLAMLLGGVTYSVGVGILIHDHRRRYLHVVWHALVVIASLIHAFGIWAYIIRDWGIDRVE